MNYEPVVLPEHQGLSPLKIEARIEAILIFEQEDRPPNFLISQSLLQQELREEG